MSLTRVAHPPTRRLPRLGATMVKASRVFDTSGKVAQSNICNSIKDKISAFKPKVPAVVALRNPGMKPRHWQQLSEKVMQRPRPVVLRRLHRPCQSVGVCLLRSEQSSGLIGLHLARCNRGRFPTPAICPARVVSIPRLRWSASAAASWIGKHWRDKNDSSQLQY